MYKNILFPTDNSEISEKAFDFVMDLAKTFNSHVVVLHSNQYYSSSYIAGGPLGSYYSDDTLEEEINFSWQEVLKLVKSKLDAAGISSEIILERGEPGPVITATADDKKSDLIVLGSRGKGAVKSILLGSVSNYVLHHTKVPVLLIH